MADRNNIVYFAGCMASYSEPVIGKHSVEVLEKNGLTPLFPDQKCCGTPQLSAGNLKRFIKNAKFNINSLAAMKGDIVTACTSCAYTLKHDYPKILKSNEAESVSQRTYDIIEYLSVLKSRERLNEDFHPLDLFVAYHTPCHLKVLGEDLADRRLAILKAIPGFSIDLLNSGCCGMGGTFGVKKKTFDLSVEIGGPLFDNVLSSNADSIVTDCPNCKLQIHQGTGRISMHPVSIVRQAYGIAGDAKSSPVSRVINYLL